MTVAEKVRARVAERQPWRIAQHPETGKYHAICRVMRVPVTDGHDTPEEALEAWRDYTWRGIMVTLASQADLSAKGLSRPQG